MKIAHLRFYEELNDFLPAAKKKIRFEHKFSGTPSVKDLIESLGIPHTEIDLILVNGKSTDFNRKINDGDDISVYPVFESVDIKEVQHLRENTLRIPKFILDVHLGKLARYLRMLGFDALYRNNYSDDEIVSISGMEARTILTKDKGILKHNKVNRGYYVRNSNPEEQLSEVVLRFDLNKSINEFTRCLECNTILKKIEKNEVADRIPEKVKEKQTDFYICNSCNKIYWPGSHYNKMKETNKKIVKQN